MSAFTQDQMQIAIDNAHIPTDEIKNDIADTEREIVQMEREEKGLRMIGDRMSIFRADNRQIGIDDRRKFITKLKTILLIREAGAI